MSRKQTIGRETIRVVLSALESPQAMLSSEYFRHTPPSVAARLLEAGLIRAEGYELTSSGGDHDRLTALTWSEVHQMYGYFDAIKGWTSVPHTQIARYRIDVGEFLNNLTARLRFVGRREPRMLLPDRLWEVGHVRIGTRHHATCILYGRRLRDQRLWPEITRFVQARSTDAAAVVLTTTSPEFFEQNDDRVLLFYVGDLLDDDLSLDPNTVALRLQGEGSIRAVDPLVILSDGREVRFYGEPFYFPRGVNQREVVKFLKKAHVEGRDAVSADEVVAELDLNPTTRMRDLFSGNRAWGRLLRERNGMLEFCWRKPK